VILTQQQAAAAFEEWERQYRADPEKFLTEQQLIQTPGQTLGELRAVTFFDIISKQRQ